MNCPRDNNHLNRNINQQVFGDCCNDCGGVFLSGDGVKAFKINFNTEVLEKTLAQSEEQESCLACPHCDSSMNVSLIDDIEIDFCQQCSGIWFDEFEADDLIEKYKYKPQNPPQSIWEEFLDIVIWLPLSLVPIYAIFFL